MRRGRGEDCLTKAKGTASPEAQMHTKESESGNYTAKHNMNERGRFYVTSRKETPHEETSVGVHWPDHCNRFPPLPLPGFWTQRIRPTARKQAACGSRRTTSAGLRNSKVATRPQGELPGAVSFRPLPRRYSPHGRFSGIVALTGRPAQDDELTRHIAIPGSPVPPGRGFLLWTKTRYRFGGRHLRLDKD